MFLSNTKRLAGVKNNKPKHESTIDLQVHTVRKEPVHKQSVLSVEMLTIELFHSKLEMSWAFGLSTAALQFCFSI